MLRFTCATIALLLSQTILVDPHVEAEEPTTQNILARWQQAAATTRQLDVKFTRLVYDHTFGVTKVATGRLNMEHTGRCHLQIDTATELPVAPRNRNRDGRPYQMRADVAHTYIWRLDEYLSIAPNSKQCIRFCFTDATAENDHDVKLRRVGGITQLLLDAMEFTRSPAFCHALDEEIADTLDEQFEITTSHEEDVSILSASPKNDRFARQCKQLNLAFSRSSAFPTAISVIDPSETRETVYIFESPKLNIVPDGANELFAPHLNGITVWESK